MSSSPSVAIIGAGIIGSSIAVNLTRKGCKVTVLDAGYQPASGATAKSWAWLNANRKSPAHYKELNKAGMEEWRRLDEQLKGDETFAEFPGTVYLGDQRDGDESYPSRKLSAGDVSRLEPEVAQHSREAGGRFYAQEGYAYPALAAAHMLDEARQQGARVHLDCEVTAFERRDETATAVCTGRGDFKADVVILAAGLGVPRLAELLGSRMALADKPGTLTVLTQPMARVLQHIIVTDEAFIMQRRDGEIMISFFKAAVNHSPGPRAAAAGGADGDADGKEIEGHIRESVHEAADGHGHEAAAHLNVSDKIAQKEITRAAEICPVLRDACLDSFSVAKYPYPPDAHPVLGWLPGLRNVYVAVTHSGATLGPLLGRLIAEEVLGTEQAALRPYRPDRDFGDKSYLY